MNAFAPLGPFAFTRTTLANGLDVIARRQGTLPIVGVNLWYHVGSKDEERRQRGFAHLFEHLMFEGSEHYPGDFFQPLQRLGAGVNGSTSSDRTNYYIDLPAAHLELALAMESDRMGHLLPALTETKLRVQKGVVQNEYRQNYANRPYGQVGRILAEALYPPAHPYNWLTIGVMADVEAASRADVEAFFRRYYVPSNASLSLVGDLEIDRALRLAERYFGPIDGGARASRPWTPPVGLGADLEIRLHDRVELDRIYDVWHTVPQFDADDAALEVLADILGRGRASRLYRRLVVAEGLAQGVSVQQHSRELAGTFGVVVTLRPGRSWERARALVLDEVRGVAEHGVMASERDRCVAGRRAGFIYALDNVGGFGGVADRLNAYNIYLGDPGRITSDFERYEAVTPADVQAVAVRYLHERPRLALVVLGRKPVVAGVGDLDRSRPPAPMRPVAYQAPRPEVRRLARGTELWVIPRRDLPIITATAVVAAGSAAHGPDRAGLASLTTAMLDEGTAQHTADGLAEAIEAMGTHLATQCGFDGCYVSFQCVTPFWSESLALAVEVLLRPTFPEPEFRRVHAQALAGLRADRDSAETRAQRGLLRAAYGADHPYGVPVDGTERAVAGHARDGLAGFHRAYFAPERCAWVVAGDVDPDAVQERLERELADWCWEGAPLLALGPPPVRDGMRLWLLDRPGAAQAVVRVGQASAPRVTADYAALLVFNQVLGGQFTSRLNHRLREEKGLTYGVRSHFDFRRGPGPFVIGGAFAPDRLAEALDDLRGELLALLDHRPPTAAELDDARRALLEGQPRHFETPAALVARYAGLFLYGLPPEEHTRFPDQLAAVTVEQVLDAARRHVSPEALQVVVVADAAAVAEPLRRLDWLTPSTLEED